METDSLSWNSSHTYRNQSQNQSDWMRKKRICIRKWKSIIQSMFCWLYWQTFLPYEYVGSSRYIIWWNKMEYRGKL